MTTVAYRDGCMAADSAAHGGQGRVGDARKVARNGAGDLCGVCGAFSAVSAFLRWFDGGEDGPPPLLTSDGNSSEQALIVRRVRPSVAQVFDSGGTHEMTGVYFALGSGRDFALGAMGAYATATAAVRVAVHFDAYSGAPVAVLFAADGDREDVE